MSTKQEAVMGQAIPRQHPAVVLRSHFNLVRSLLAIAMAAVVALTVTVVIVANDEDQVAGGTSAAKPIESINYQGFNSATGRPDAAPLPQQQVQAPNTRYDGGPDEGTRGPLTSALAPNSRYDGGPDEGTRGPQTQGGPRMMPQGPGSRYDGGPEEGTRGPRF
jgi:hypothetical protein